VGCTGVIEAFVLAPAPAPDPAALGLEDGRATLGRVAVIGASRGFGAALALALLARGFEVDGVYSSSPDRAAELTRLAGSRRGDLHMHQADARDPRSLERLAAQPLQGLVLSAAPPPLAMGLAGAELADYVA